MTGVALGAWGAHGLANYLGGASTGAWDTAVFYQLIHGLALLLVALLAQQRPSRALTVSAYAFVLGVVLFSGSIYALVLGGPRWLGPVTPFGGSALIIGWLALLMAAWQRHD